MSEPSYKPSFDTSIDALLDPGAESDYIELMANALSALKNIPGDEHSEEVGETLGAVIEDLEGVLSWLRGTLPPKISGL